MVPSLGKKALGRKRSREDTRNEVDTRGRNEVDTGGARSLADILPVLLPYKLDPFIQRTIGPLLWHWP